MEEQGRSVAVSDDMLVEGLPVEIFTEFDVNMDNVVEIDTEGESTGKIPGINTPNPSYNKIAFQWKAYHPSLALIQWPWSQTWHWYWKDVCVYWKLSS